MSSVDPHEGFFWHDESLPVNIPHDIMDILPSIQDIREVEVLTVHQTRLLQTVGQGQSDEGDELVRGPGGVVGELLLLQTSVGTSVIQRRKHLRNIIIGNRCVVGGGWYAGKHR